MKKYILIALGAALLLFAGAAAWMIGPAFFPPRDVAVGITKGAKVPVSLPLAGADGGSTSLSAHMGKRGMVLLMIRSADWCPFCHAQLKRSQDIAATLGQRGFTLASVSYDKPAILRKFIDREHTTFAMFSDEKSAMIDALGLRDPQYPKGSFAYGVPRASVLVIAPDGTVLERFVAADYRARPSNAMVLAMVDKAIAAQ